jgi:hypothetical protein
MAMRKRLGLVAGMLLAAVSAQAFAAQPTEQQVRQLMDAIGLGRSLSQMNTQVATSMKQSLPCVSSTYWQGYIDENSSKEFIGRLVPVYQKHFTADEVEGMVKFYSSPLGQKVLTEMPLALAEANQAGQQWSRDHTQQMIAKLEQAGTLSAEGRCPASFAGGPASAASAADGASDSSDDTAADAPDVAVAATTHRATGHAATVHQHGHVVVKKHATPAKAAPAKKATTSKATTSKPAASKKSAPAKPATSTKSAPKHHTATKTPASGTQKTAPAGQ